MNYKNLLLTAAMVLTVNVATAQEDVKSYSYVEAQGGLQLTSTNVEMTKLLTPTAALSFGHYFSPVVGVRNLYLIHVELEFSYCYYLSYSSRYVL